MDRRLFIETLLLGFGTAAFAGPVSYTKNSGSKGSVLLLLERKASQDSLLRVFNWDKLTHEDFVVPLKVPHSVVRNNLDANEVFIFEMIGTCVKLNLKTGLVMKVPKLGSTFLGHGAMSPNGESILCTEALPGERRASLTLRSSDKLELIKALTPEIGSAHQAVYLPGTEIIASGSIFKDAKSQRGGVSFYDVKAGKIIKQIEVPYPVAHVMALSSTEVAAVGNVLKSVGDYPGPKNSSVSITEYFEGFTENTSTPVYVAHVNGGLQALKSSDPKHDLISGFGLARLKDTPGAFLSGHTRSDTIVSWLEGKPQKYLSVDAPLNIMLSDDQKELMVVSKGALKIFDVKTFASLRTIKFDHDILGLNAY